MSDIIQSITVKELKQALKDLPEDAQVFISQDEEGNGYGTISASSFEYQSRDNVIAFYPVRERLEWDEVFPATWKFMEEDE